MIGKEVGIIVQHPDHRTRQKVKYVSAHDLRRGCAQRLINVGVSAETLKVIMRHRDFATTERYCGAMRSAQSAAAEVAAQMSTHASPNAFIG
ncbi:MAG: tyrosine-type recombinase/integrase [Planctomycetaceae bacterium]|nr:tyrosine-type recombinase/integrase [Planctomycetaceae bacterium]